MKKLLALVLALVMTLSLCVVSSNAKFDDAADIDFKEAADVMQAVGVFVGDGSGNFYPKQNLTREQAAKVIAYLDLGESVAEALPSIGTFSDVSSWANKYVDYLANAKIVNGIGGGKFGGTNQVTGYEFAKMLLVVLGWDAEIEGMTGSAWQIGVAKLVKEYKLAKGYKTNLSAPLTREAAAKLTFNAIQRAYVEKYEYDGGFTIVNNELSYNAKGEAKLAKKTVGGVTKNELFYEHHWTDNDKLTYDGTATDFGQPSHSWKYQGKKIGTYTDEPVMTVTKSIKLNKLYDEVKEAGYLFDTDNATDYDVDMTVWMNGYEFADVNAGSDTSDTSHLKQFLTAYKDVEIPDGMVLELYADDDNYITDAVLISYQLLELETKVADKASTKLIDERALWFENPYYDDAYEMISCDAEDKPAGFDAVYEAAEEGDMVLVAIKAGFMRSSADYEVIGVKMPTTMEGKISFISEESTTGYFGNWHGKVTVDGENYPLSYNFYYANDYYGYDFSSKDTYTFYLDENGYVCGADITNVTANVYGVLKTYKSLNEDGEEVVMAQVVKADGTEARIELDDSSALANDTLGKYGRIFFLNLVDGAYTDCVAPSHNVGFVTANLHKNDKLVEVMGDKYAFADDYKIIYLGQGEDLGKYTVSTKLQDVTASECFAEAVFNRDNKITTLFVRATADTVISNVKSLLFLAARTGYGTDTKANGTEYDIYKYDAYVDGVKVEGGITALDNVASVGGFYKVAQDTAKKNYYKLSGNGFAKQGANADYYWATEEGFDVGNYFNDTLINVDGNTVEITSSTKVVCTVEDVEINNMTTLKTLLKANEYDDADVTVLYDSETNDALYVYIFGLDN